MTGPASVLVLYYSRNGSTAKLARAIARGVESANATAVLRTVPPVTPTTDAGAPPVPGSGPPYATLQDLRDCDGLMLGSPTRFGNIAAPLKYFLDRTSELWLDGALADKPAGVFTSSSSLHGGQESTLLTMAVPLLHHGMICAGLPYTRKELFDTRTGGSPYGATHLAADWNGGLSPDEKSLAVEHGRRIARLAAALRVVRHRTAEQ